MTRSENYPMVNNQYKIAFQLKMLTIQEEKFLNNRDADFIKTFAMYDPDIPSAVMQESESTSKYSLSYCDLANFHLMKGAPPVGPCFLSGYRI